jgi:CBS domain-containing protein
MAHSGLSVEDLMTTAVVPVKATTTIARAELEMKVAGFRHLPVVDEHENLIGILSNRDLLAAPHGEKRAETPVGRIMTTAVRTVRPDTPAADAVEIMIRHKIGSLPVVADDGRLVGLLTETDFLVVAHQALRGIEPRAPRAEA